MPEMRSYWRKQYRDKKKKKSPECARNAEIKAFSINRSLFCEELET